MLILELLQAHNSFRQDEMSAILEDVRKKLIGTWRNVSTTAELPNDPSSRQDLYGDDVNGFLMFSEDGYMLTLTTKANGDDPRAYAASFSLVEEEGTGPVLLHHAKAANEIQQPWVGTDQVRIPKFTVEDGVEYLNLTARIALSEGGEERLVVVKWKRAERHDPLAKQSAT